VRSMATEMPAWLKRAQGDMQHRMHSPKYQPISQPSTQPAAAGVEAGAIRREAASRSHNTFRPDIYRVSEGYLT
jgi:hypothetical protein